MKDGLIIFDLDGTLCDCRQLHYEALNEALRRMAMPIITQEQHNSVYDGMNTRAKLSLMGVKDIEKVEKIFKLKQEETIRLANSTICSDVRLWWVLRILSYDFNLCVASNSIKETVRVILQRLGIIEWFDFYLSNEDVPQPKPSRLIYDMAMIKTGFKKENTLIIEDSDTGIEGAEKIYSKLMRVKDSSELTYDNIIAHWNKN